MTGTNYEYAAGKLLGALKDMEAIAATLAEGRELEHALDDGMMEQWQNAKDCIIAACLFEGIKPLGGND